MQDKNSAEGQGITWGCAHKGWTLWTQHQAIIQQARPRVLGGPFTTQGGKLHQASATGLDLILSFTGHFCHLLAFIHINYLSLSLSTRDKIPSPDCFTGFS